MKKIFLVDGSGFIFRAYHALPPLRRPDGLPVGAVFGFCNMLMKLKDMCESDGDPHYLAVIFDAGRKTFRNEIYPDYKAHRPPPPPDLIPQFPLFREACQAFHLPCLELEGFEADDLIASYAKHAQAHGFEVVIVSSDKDLMQLIRPGVSLYDPLKNKPIGADEVREKFGVGPDQVVDILSLAGDSSDNVPGVPGIGPKTAAELIQTYGDLETLLANTAQIKQPKRRETLEAHAQAARLSKELVILRDDAPLPLDLETLQIQKPETLTLRDFLSQQGFQSLITRLTPSNSPSETQSYSCITTQPELKIWIQRALKTPVIAIDCETNSLNEQTAQLVGISLSTGPGEACYIPLAHTTGEPHLSRDDVILALAPLFADPAILKVGHNLKYDMRIFARYGLHVAPYDDTMLMSTVLNGGRHSHSMDELALRYLNHNTIKFDQVAGKGKDQKTFDQVPLKQATAYAAEDADITLQLYHFLKKQLPGAGVATLYETVERPLIPVIVGMEQQGILLNTLHLITVGREFDHIIAQLEKVIWQEAGRSFNIGSPKQLGEVLFEELKYPAPKKNKTGNYSTDADTLEGLVAQGFSLATKILEWRGLSKLKSTYVDGLLSAVNPQTGRIHTSYSLAGTSTGRLASSDPNLQNIPVRTPNGRLIRRSFVAETGYQLLSLDYSQIELRLLAHIAHIPTLIDAFNHGEDIHARTASQIFGVPLDQVDALMRRKAKAINFGIIYGISAYGLSQQLNIPQGEAQRYIQAYFEHYPGIQAYMTRAKAFAREHGFVTTIMGRRCYTPGIQDQNPVARQFAERQAINAPLQGSNADIIKKAMIHVPESLAQHKLQARMLLQVHDELVFEVPQDQLAETTRVLSTLMSQIVQLKVPLVVDAKHGQNWSYLE